MHSRKIILAGAMSVSLYAIFGGAIFSHVAFAADGADVQSIWNMILERKDAMAKVFEEVEEIKFTTERLAGYKSELNRIMAILQEQGGACDPRLVARATKLQEGIKALEIENSANLAKLEGLYKVEAQIQSKLGVLKNELAEAALRQNVTLTEAQSAFLRIGDNLEAHYYKEYVKDFLNEYRSSGQLPKGAASVDDIPRVARQQASIRMAKMNIARTQIEKFLAEPLNGCTPEMNIKQAYQQLQADLSDYLERNLTPEELAEIKNAEMVELEQLKNRTCEPPKPVECPTSVKKLPPPPPTKGPCPPGTTPKIVPRTPSTTLGSGAGSLQAVYERVVLNASQHTGVRAAFRAAAGSVVKYGGITLRLVGRGAFALLEILNPAGWVLLAGDFANFLVDQWSEQTLRSDIEMARQVTVDVAENDLKRIERLWPQYLEALEKEVRARACAQPTEEYTGAQKLLIQMLRFKMDYIEQQSRRYAVLLKDVELLARRYEDPDYLVSQQEALATVIRGNIERDGNRIRAFSEVLFAVVFEEKFEEVKKIILEKSLTTKPSCNGEDIVCEKDDGNGGGGGGAGGGGGSGWEISGADVCNFPIMAYTDRGEERYDPKGSRPGSVGYCIGAVQCCAMADCAPGPYANVWGMRLRSGRVARIWGCQGLPRELPEGACRQPEFTSLEINALCNESEQEWPPALRARVAALEQAANRELTGSAGSAAGGAIGSVTRSDKSLAKLFGSGVSSPGTFLRALLKNRL